MGQRESVIAAGGHEVEWVGDWSADPGDEQILAHAAADRRVLVTIDKDFGELAVVHGVPHAGIIRVVGFAAPDQGPACVAALARYGEELQAGALVTGGAGANSYPPARRCSSSAMRSSIRERRLIEPFLDLSPTLTTELAPHERPIGPEAHRP